MTPTDELCRAQDGDPAAFGRFVQCTIDDVTRLCSYLGDHDHADDLVQDTYLRALRGLHSYRADSDALQWLLTIARRACADSIAHRQRSRRPELTRRPAIEHTATSELQLLIDQLPHDQRSAFVLTRLLGYRYDEAAAICECPIGTIRSRVARARTQLATIITRRNPTCQLALERPDQSGSRQANRCVRPRLSARRTRRRRPHVGPQPAHESVDEPDRVVEKRPT